MELTLASIKKDQAAFEKAGIRLPRYDVAALMESSPRHPVWVHMGAGNIFHGFIATIAQRLLDQGLMKSGILTLSAYDGENCCTYNLLKLAQRVFMYNADQASADYIERALYNHILGQQDPATSMVTYFTPLQTGAYRLYSTRDSSFWCCVGSGFESHVRYASYIYYHSDDALWVNLLIPSTVDWQGTRLTQVTDFPASGLTVLTVSGQSRRFTLHLRKPWWATSVTVRVNGKRVSGLNITRLWKASDKVEVSYGMALHEEATTDDPTRVALLYGPIVLGGELDSVAHPFSDPKKYNDYYTYDYQVPASLPTRCTYHRLSDVKPEGRLQWCVGDITVRPFYDIHHHRYVVYWKKQ